MTPSEFTQSVISRLEHCQNERTRAVSSSLIRHLHAFVAEVRPSHAEWLSGIEFLTRTGKTCDEDRQEFILLSDVLGVSMLVDLINHAAAEGVTDSTVLGPFFSADHPLRTFGASLLERPEAGTGLRVQGRVAGQDRTPLAGARLDVWQTSPEGLYDVQNRSIPRGHLRGAFMTDPNGTYCFETVVPHSYPIPTDGPVGDLLAAQGRHPYRPAHIHFMIRTPGYRPLVTHLFMDRDPYLDSDAVFGVKPELIVRPQAGPSGRAELRFDFGLALE